MYKYITIQAIPAPLDEVLDDGSEYNVGVARERELAESAPYLIKRIAHLEFLIAGLRKDNDKADEYYDKEIL
jgi:hypothetical protein